MPPPELAHDLRHPEAFRPAPEVEEWLRSSFIEPGGPLHNEDHGHLGQAVIGVLWTNVANVKQMRAIAGTAEIPKPTNGSKWQKARLQYQLEEWFGDVPDFLITLDAVYAAETDDIGFCALVEHELYHCAQAVDAYGMPRFHKETGRPIFSIRGHDVEEFVGVVRRYGPVGLNVREIAAAAFDTPRVARGAVRVACGTCLV